MLPKFSLRIALFMLTAGAVVAMVFSLAMQGQVWAVGVSLAIGSVAVSLLVHAVFYGLTKFFGLLERRPPSNQVAPSSGEGK